LKLKASIILPILAVGVVAFLAFGGYLYFATDANAVGIRGPIDPASAQLVDNCGKCHSMDKQVTEWQTSPHKDVACMECHEESQATWVRHELSDRNPEMAATKDPAVKVLPIKAINDRCLDCHASQLDAVKADKVPAPLKAGTVVANQGQPLPVNAAHTAHLKPENGLDCTTCHADSAHGPKAGTPEAKDATHTLCLDCHAQKNVTIKVTGSTSCGACHADPKTVTPPDHTDKAAWTKAHGDASKQGTCGECHLGPTAGAHGKLANSAAFPSSSPDACASCHAGIAMPHPQDWLNGHADKFSANKAACATCHGSKENPANLPNTGICIECHQVPMPHSSNYLSVHGTNAEQLGAGTCDTCHSPSKNPISPTPEHARADYCTACHQVPMPHSADYLKSHGQQAMTKGITCEACHSSKNKANPTAAHASATFCSSCHDQYQHQSGWVAAHGEKVDATCGTCHTLIGQPGQHNACSTCHSNPDGKWHPDLFYVSHANIVQKQGRESCDTCHNEVGPKCSQCHRNY
jgi:hypothetical protein